MSTPVALAAIITAAIALAALTAAADSNGEVEYEGYEDEEYDEGYREELAEPLGTLSLALGIPSVAGYTAYKRVYIRMARMNLKPPVSLSGALKLHITFSTVLGLAALLHGALLIESAGPVEYAAGLLVAMALASGATLYYLRRSGHKRYARVIHVQMILAAALLIVTLIHVASVD